MRNINELIGIINGVNFDGVINNKEIVYLQTWINKNRNLVYEQKQVELIKLVDTVLEDQIITEDERKILIAYCKDYLKSLYDDTAKIYELNGIIAGIVCDDEVNEAEVRRLKEWMDIYGESIRGHRPSEILCKAIDNILEDGVVTEDEQEQLLKMLSVRISVSQFETKLEYLKKQVRLRKNIGVDLIDLLDNEDAIDEIHNRAELELIRSLNSYSGIYMFDKEIVFISLVLIAMLHYDGNYYENVKNTYNNLYGRYSEQKIEGLIRTILSRYRSVEDANSGRVRIINVALSNAIVPSYFLKAFFEFIYDIYKLNFEYTLSDDIYEDFHFVYDGLRSSMLSDEEDLQVNVTKKSYKLIKSTKKLITNDKHIDAVIKLSIIIAKLIDKKIWDKEIKITNPYLKHGFEGWIDKLNEDNGAIRQRGKSEFRSRWEPKYVLSNNKVFMVAPIHRVKSGYDFRTIKVVVTNGKSELYVNKTPDIREIIGGYQISVNKIQIENPLGEITYQLFAGGENIYDSKSKLHRPFIVFGNEGEEIQNNTDYSGTAAFCTRNKCSALKEFYNTDNFVLSAASIKLGDVVVIEETLFNFSSLIKPGVFGEEWDDCYITTTFSDEQIQVFKNTQFLVFESDNRSARFEVLLDSKIYKIDDFQYTVTAREGVVKYVVDINNVKNGIHQIGVLLLENGKKNKIFSCRFAIDPKLNAETIKMDDSTYLVAVTSDIINSDVIEEINAKDFREDWLRFSYRGKEYNYFIPFGIDYYRINGSQWIPFDNELWIEDIKQDTILDIYGNEVDELLVYTSSGEEIDETLKLKSQGVYKQVHIGFLTTYKVNYDYTVLLLLNNGKGQKAIYCYNKCILDEESTEISYDPMLKTLDIMPMFYGKGNIFFTVTDPLGCNVYKSSFLKKGVSVSAPELKSFVNYTIAFCEKEKGLSIKKERVLKEYEQIFYAREDFIGKSFKIKEVYFDQYIRGEFLRKKHYFNRIYVFFKNKISENFFSGEIYAETYNGTFVLDKVNPVEIEICSDVVDESVELAITKDGDGLLLDFKHHSVMNTMDDINAVDIFSYTMKMDGVKQF